MDFSFSEEQLMIIEGAKRFAEEKLAPVVEELDAKGEPNVSALRELGQLGYLGMMVPPEFGGADVGVVAYAGSMVELSKMDAGTSVAVSVHNSLVNDALLKYGTEDQKREFFPKLTSGEWLGCFSLTEPGAGSDPGAMIMAAQRDGEGWLLNGTKNFTTSGSFADFIVVFAQTDPSRGSKGISAFVLTKDAPGYEVGKLENKMGIRSATCTELVFSDCRLPASALLGEENEGLKIALSTLDGGRIGIASQAIGIAEAALDEAVGYAKERIQFGKPIAEFQSIQFMLADMATELEMAKSMLYRVAWMKDAGQERVNKEAAMLKLFASEMSHRVCHKALQIHGGYGYMKEYKVERLYRDQRITEIYEGTSEIQRYVIAKHLLED